MIAALQVDSSIDTDVHFLNNSSDKNSNALTLFPISPSGNLIKTTIELPKPSVKSCKDKEMGPIKLG